MTTRKIIDKSSHEFCIYRDASSFFIRVHIYVCIYLPVHDPDMFPLSLYVRTSISISISASVCLSTLEVFRGRERMGIFLIRYSVAICLVRYCTFLQLTSFISHNLTFGVLGSRDAKANQT